jgi:hypothetical protein
MQGVVVGGGCGWCVAIAIALPQRRGNALALAPVGRRSSRYDQRGLARGAAAAGVRNENVHAWRTVLTYVGVASTTQQQPQQRGPGMRTVLVSIAS